MSEKRNIESKISGTNIEGVAEDDDAKLIWDINIQCDNVVEARRPGLILVDRKGQSCVIVDIAVPGGCRVREKELEKIEK